MDLEKYIELERIRKEVLQPLVKSLDIQAYMVGGCVRAFIHNESINDVDIVCSNPGKLIEGLVQYAADHDLFQRVHEMSNGHATVVHTYGIQFEISKLSGDLQQDARNRDFICNSWYIPIHEDGEAFSPLQEEFVIHAIRERVLIPCNDHQTFIDNPLRIFRAMDMISRGYIPSASLALSIQRAMNNIKSTRELRYAALEIVHKIFDGLAHKDRSVENVIYAFNYMAELGVWGKLVDEHFQAMVDCRHNGKYHHDSVWQHTMEVIRHLASRAMTLGDALHIGISPNSYDYWAALLHDIGKPGTMTIDENGVKHFYDHQTLSCKIAENILKDSPASKTMTKYVLDLIGHHMDTKPFGDEPISKDQYKHIRKLMYQLGEDIFNRLLALNYADCAASDRPKNENSYNILNVITQMINDGEPNWFIYRLPITGDDIKKEIPDIPPECIGICLEQLYKVTFAHPSGYATKEQCIHYIKTLIHTGWLKGKLNTTKES